MKGTYLQIFGIAMVLCAQVSNNLEVRLIASIMVMVILCVMSMMIKQKK